MDTHYLDKTDPSIYVTSYHYVNAILNSVVDINSTSYFTNAVNVDLNYAPGILRSERKNKTSDGDYQYFRNSSLNSYDYLFYNCQNLVNVTHLNQNTISLHSTFYNCINLTDIPEIPNSVTDMAFTFHNCDKLINAPTVPNSVTNLYYSFCNCTNLAGNIYIYSNQVTNAMNCFSNGTADKNVYIPFAYENGEYTQTYNSFINAGYTSLPSTTTDKATLVDVNGKIITQWAQFSLPRA